MTTRWITADKLERNANDILQDYVKEHNLIFKKVNLHEQIRRKRATILFNKKKSKRLRNEMKESLKKATFDKNAASTLIQESQEGSDAESSTTDEDVIVVQIRKHKKLKNNNLMFELQFSDGTTDWSDYHCTKIDCEDLLIKYMRKNNLSNQKTEKALKHVTSKTGVDKKWEKLIKPHKCNQSHDWIDLVEETLPGYFRNGARWYGLKCTKCQIVVSDKNSKGVFTPSVLRPVYMCGNRSSGCIYLLCSSCYCMQIKNSNNRRSTRKNDEKGSSGILI